MVRRLALFALVTIFAAPLGEATAATPRCNGRLATIVASGANGDDVIVGTNGVDDINGRGRR